MSQQTSKQVLHIGCDPRGRGGSGDAPFPFDRSAWREIRLDIDPRVEPDIVASMTDMNMIDDASVDAIWSHHNLERLCAHEVPVALAEFSRVVKPDGFLLACMPDLQAAAVLVAQDKLLEPAYVSAGGPIAPLDMIYGYRRYVQVGGEPMMHRTGFTARTLGGALIQAGFKGKVRRTGFELWALGHKGAAPDLSSVSPTPWQ